MHPIFRLVNRNLTISLNPGFLIWQIILKLNKGQAKEIKQKADDYLEKRINTQPKLPSAGCIFKNFLLDDVKNNNEKLAKLAIETGVEKGGKISAGWVIEYAGIAGKRIGDAKISLEHANFIVNTGKASADHIVMLISYIKQQVRAKTNLQLKEEIQYFGF